MLPFFRKIRYRLAKDNQFLKYSRYAIGEIILVVIGILIALQINNWNEDQKIKRQETILVKNLMSEFKVNLENLREIQEQYTLLYNSTFELKNLIGQDNKIIKDNNIDSLLYHAISIRDFQPNQFIYSQLKAGKNLDNIKSEKLKKLLYEWDKLLNLKTETFNYLTSYYMGALIPFLDENTSMRNIDFYGNFDWSNKTPLKYNYSKMFNMIQFDNRLENHLWNVSSFKDLIDQLITIVERIIEELSEEHQ